MWCTIPKSDRAILEPWIILFAFLIAPFTNVRSLAVMAKGSSGWRVPGIVSLELAGSARCQTVLSSYRDHGVIDHAVISVWADFVFILSYSVAIGLGCLLSAQANQDQRPRLARLGLPFTCAIAVAAILDVVEDVALLCLLYRGGSDDLAETARISALVKFGLIIAALLYIGIACTWARKWKIGTLTVASSILIFVDVLSFV